MLCTDSVVFLQNVVDILLDYIRESNDRKSLVVEFHHPNKLRQVISDLLEIDTGDSKDEKGILEDCRETLKYCVRTGQCEKMAQCGTTVSIAAISVAFTIECIGAKTGQLKLSVLCFKHDKTHLPLVII